MKINLIIGLLAISFYSCLNSGGRKDLFKKIDNKEIITKVELEKLLLHKFNGFEEKFWGTGGYSTSGNLIEGIFQGIKMDTLYDVLVVFKGDKCLFVKEHPRASIYRIGEAIHNEYMLGRIYTTLVFSDTTCIKAYFETIQPFKVDTLSYKFRYDMCKVLSKDSLEFYSGNKQ
jgi:hypothetical protein